MLLRLRRVVLVAAVTATACGLRGGPGATPASPDPEVSAPSGEPGAEADPAAADPGPEESAAPSELPTECAGSRKPCVPPKDFVDRLCGGGRFPGVAMVMFEKSSPWTRMYVRVLQGIDSVNVSSGSSGDSRLTFGEEVIVLVHERGAGGGVQVSGSAGYFVLRWDGTCATLSGDELTAARPGLPRFAPFEWKFIDPAIQHALGQDPQIAEARDEFRRECRGAPAGTGDKACAEATKRLHLAVVGRLRKGMKLPLPDRLP